MTQSKLSIEVTPLEVKRRLDAGEPIYLVDVREPKEHQQASVAGAELIPMRTIPANLQKIEAKADDADIVIFCHRGMRSLQVANWLREQGVLGCQSMAGGIDRWSLEVDPNVPRYWR